MSDEPEKTEVRHITVFYDAPCIDGAGSAWSFRERFKDDPSVEVSYVALEHNSPDARHKIIFDNLDENTEAFFLDTAPSKCEIGVLLSPDDADNGKAPKSRVKSVTIWDHHESTKERMDAYKVPHIDGFDAPPLDYDVDVEQPSAAFMTWQKLFEDKEPPEILEWIGRMEPTGTLRNDKDYAIAAYIDTQNIETMDNIVSSMEHLINTQVDDMLRLGKPILDYQISIIQKMLKEETYAHVKPLEHVDPIWIPMVNTNVQYFGRLIHKALVEAGAQGASPEIYGVWCQLADGSVKLSLRSEGEPNVARIAKYVGKTLGAGDDYAGGHPNASVVTFTDLEQFQQNVQPMSKEAKRKILWQETPDNNKGAKPPLDSGNTTLSGIILKP